MVVAISVRYGKQSKGRLNMNKCQKKPLSDQVRMILKGPRGNKRLTRRSIARDYPELKELIKVL